MDRPSRLMRAPFVLLYLAPAIFLILRYWPWSTARVSNAMFLAAGLGGLAILVALSALVLPGLLRILGASAHTARAWRRAAGDAVIGPLLLTLYLAASKIVRSLGVFLAVVAVLTAAVAIGAVVIERRAPRGS